LKAIILYFRDRDWRRDEVRQRKKFSSIFHLRLPVSIFHHHRFAFKVKNNVHKGGKVFTLFNRKPFRNLVKKKTESRRD
jgi:hypothetical protein